MTKATDIGHLRREIDAYEDEAHFTGAPLLVGVDGKADYEALVRQLHDDHGKRILRMSDMCGRDFPPDPAFFIAEVKSAAKSRPVVWLGAAQAKMLYGQRETERFLINLLGVSFLGPVIVLCPFCCATLHSIARRYEKLGRQIIVLESRDSHIPFIHVSPERGIPSAGTDVVLGIPALLRALEDGKTAQKIALVTSCKFSYLENSMYPISEEHSPYARLCRQEAAIAARTQEGNGTPAQWQQLARDLREAGSLSALCERRLCAVNALKTDFADFLAASEDVRFLCFICLKVFCGDDGDYLADCLSKAQTADELETCIYMRILDIVRDEVRFPAWLRQRRRMLLALDENSALMKDFCTRATIKGKLILWYLRDETEEERAAIIHALCSYAYTREELLEMLPFASPNLFLYLQPFAFDKHNTRVMESDAAVLDLLTDYFSRYKLQKLTNRQDADFIALVEAEARARSFTRLQSRSKIVNTLDRGGAEPYFFDALGVEFLSFMQKKADEYGMRFDCRIGRCNLPSITSVNKEFYDAFPPESIRKEEGLDDIKHEGTRYDFQKTAEPLHIFDELSLLDRDLKKMGSALAMGHCERIIILSDHGASRLAVTCRSENDKLQLEQPGAHSGRCCPAPRDPQIDFVTYENGFAVLANYQRFKGSRKADVEAHGGATLEEVVVPVITLTPKPKEQLIFFEESTVTCSPLKGSSIRLFAEPPLHAPRMTVNGQNYEGRFDGDHHNVVFDMPDLRRKGRHEAEIYDGGVKVASLSFETRRNTGEDRNLL